MTPADYILAELMDALEARAATLAARPSAEADEFEKGKRLAYWEVLSLFYERQRDVEHMFDEPYEARPVPKLLESLLS